MPPLLNYPAIPRRIYVHTGEQIDKRGFAFINQRIDQEVAAELNSLYWRNMLSLGAIIGEVDIVGCTDKSDSPWFTGPYALMLANPTLYEKPLPCKGKLGFFEVYIAGRKPK